MFEVRNHFLFFNGKQVPFDNSPNHRGKQEPHYVLVHYTGDEGRGGLNWLIVSRGKQAVSAHLWISKTGEVRQLVAFDNCAWHAGFGDWEDHHNDMNSDSIGIELQEDKGDDWPEPQIAALIEVLVALHHAYPIGETIGHDDYAPGRKSDPGPNFPWDEVIEGLDKAGIK